MNKESYVAVEGSVGLSDGFFGGPDGRPRPRLGVLCHVLRRVLLPYPFVGLFPRPHPRPVVFAPMAP